MLHVLIVDDDPGAAASLAALLGQQEGYSIVGFADDLRSSLELARRCNVHIAFIDIHLACLDSGYRIADELNHMGISCVFVTATEPPFSMPELAAAWLEEPYTAESVAQSLRLAAVDLLSQAQSAGLS